MDLIITVPFVTAGDTIRFMDGCADRNTYKVAQISNPTSASENYEIRVVPEGGGDGHTVTCWPGTRVLIVARGDSHDPTPRNDRLVKTWLDSRTVVGEVMRRAGFASSRRPPIGDPRHEQYQQDVMVPLIEERDAARAAVKEASSAQFAARQFPTA